MATIIGTLLVAILCKYFGDNATMFIGFFLFMICCALTNYAELFSTFRLLSIIKEYYPVPFYNSFPAAVLWIIFGQIFAKHAPKIPLVLNIGLLIVSLLLLLYEQKITEQFFYTDDSYIMLIPVCILLFALIKHCKIKIPYAKQLRIFSTVTYCLHASLAPVIRGILRCLIESDMWRGEGMMVFAMTIIGCIATVGIIKNLERKGMRWMKAFY